MALNLEHIEWTQSGRTLRVLDAQNQPTGQLCYQAAIGEENIDDGAGGFAPFLIEAGNKIKYGKDAYELEFATGEQIIRKAAQVLCRSFKLYVQAYIGGQWVNQPHGTPTRQMRSGEVFRDGSWETNEKKATGFLSFPDARLSFGAQNPYDLYVGLEAGGEARAKMGIRLRAPATGQVRILAVLDGLEKLPTDWEWLWYRYLPEKGKEDRKRGVRVKNLQWIWSYDESPFRDIVAEDNTDGTKKITVVMGPYDITANEWLTIYPDTFNDDIPGDYSDCDQDASDQVKIFGVDSDGDLVGYAYSNENDIGLRFENVTCSGTAQDGCKITVYQTYGSTMPLTSIKGIDEANPAVWDDDPDDGPHDRTQTTASVSWTPTDNDNADQDTYEIKTIIQELIDSYTYTGSQAMAFAINQTGQGSGYNFQMEDYTMAGTNQARLTIVYTTGGANTYTASGSETPTGAASRSLNMGRSLSGDL